MALLWADGFDHYGGSVARMLDGVYSSIDAISLRNTSPRTGDWALYVATYNNNSGARRVLPSPRTNVGLGFAFNLDQLPTDSSSLGMCQLLDYDTRPLLTVLVSAVGSIVVRLGGRLGEVVGESGYEVVMPGSYQHFECAYDNGNFEVRINTITVVNITGLVLASPVSQLYMFGCLGYPKTGAMMCHMDVDDSFVRDGEGATVNTFVGDKKAYLRMPASDGLHADWVPSTGSDMWPILDNIPPNDAQFIAAEEEGDKASVGLDSLPAEVVSISGVYITARLWKTDAGAAAASIDVASGSATSSTPDLSISNRPRWYGQPFDVDPNTLMPWTVSGFNASNPTLTRKEV